ncbi:MAG: hypothetical protein Q9197_006968, partial [Variospora fuerteventurae]
PRVGREAKELEEDGFHAGILIENVVHGRAVVAVVGRSAESERDLVEDGVVKGRRLLDECEVPKGKFVAISIGFDG